MAVRTAGRSRLRVYQVREDAFRQDQDAVATEEPLEIRLETGGRTVPLAVTMRTPGDDYELAAGYLFGEGVLRQRADLLALSHCIDPQVDAAQRHNIVNALLRPGLTVDLRRLDRHVFQSSACGVCGKASLDQLETRDCGAPRLSARVSHRTLLALPERLRQAQGLFDATGGLHAAGLFAADGRLLAAREDVGRHNAVDKLVGWAFLADRLPLSDHLLLVSGRASFEILQKAYTAGLPVVCAVSAPSSLAVDLARRFGITLVGFLRDRRFNVYAGRERLLLPGEGESNANPDKVPGEDPPSTVTSLRDAAPGEGPAADREANP